MNFQQLRSVREAVRHGFNLTEVANTLHTSQPGVSRQIRELEEELGIELFVRAGKRLTGLTDPGAHVLPIVERLLQDSANLQRASEEFNTVQRGELRVAATHSQARYAMPEAVREFRQAFPQVRLHLHQGSPQQVAAMVLAGEVDVGIATEALDLHDGLVTLPSYRWTHHAVVPEGHALLTDELTLERLAAQPLITYDRGFTGRTRIDEVFARHQLAPDIMLTAMDADVIKTYAQLGLGVGIIASIAYEAERDTGLRALDLGALFGVNVTKVALRRGAYLRGYVYAFIEAFSPTLTREVIGAALADGSSGPVD